MISQLNTGGTFKPTMSRQESKAERTNAAARQIAAAEKAEVDAKTARLRALRLAREAAEAAAMPAPKKAAGKGGTKGR